MLMSSRFSGGLWAFSKHITSLHSACMKPGSVSRGSWEEGEGEEEEEEEEKLCKLRRDC